MNSMRLVRPSSALARQALLATAVLALLAGCGTSPTDATANMSNDKLYSEAREEASMGNFEQAGKLYEKLEGRATGTVLSQQAQLELAYTQFKSGEKALAQATIERFLKLHPTSPAFDYALYLQGIINFNDNLGILGSLTRQDLSERDQQAARDAFQSFKQLVDRFPQSKYAPDAQLRMNYIVNSLASYEVHVARYYYLRGAYLAAANRAQQTLIDFQTSPATEEALYIMAQSYDKLGLIELRDDTDRVLKTNFPKSEFLSQGFRGPDKPWWQVW
jgi:outer membrane protein assembly factor BamD